jgi:di/tricarboxylate transporter
MTLPILFVLGLVLVASLLLISDRMRPDLVALLVLVVLGLTRLVAPDDLFSGFSRAAVITILSLYIITAGLERTGASRILGTQLGRVAGRSEARAVVVVMVGAATLSLMMNTVAAAAVLLPATIGLARQAELRPSRLLMPLSFGALLGGMATLFTTANLLVSASLADHGFRGFGVLDFLPAGLPMAAAGILFMAVAGRRLLPSRRLGGQDAPARPTGTLAEAYGMSKAVSACYVKPGSAMAGLSVAEGQWGEQLSLNVIGIARGGEVDLAPARNEEVLEGDVVLFTGIIDEADLARYGLVLSSAPEWKGSLASDRVSLVEVTLSPRSEFAGKTLRELHFRDKYDLSVLAIWREGSTLRDALAYIPLRFGDALLLQGRRSKIALLRDEPGLLVLEEDTGPFVVPRRAWLALALTAAAFALAAFNVLPIAESAFAAAVLMIALGCLDMGHAYQAIEWRTIFLIAGMLPLGLALGSTGAAALIGSGLVNLLGRLGPLAVAAGLFWVSTVLTQIISGQVAPVVLAPIAIAAAGHLHLDPHGLAMAVALGCSTAFLTPISHSANLLVMGPGGYHFKDYARVGLPLTLVLFVVLLPALWLFWGVR